MKNMVTLYDMTATLHFQSIYKTSNSNYRLTSIRRHSLLGNKIVDHSDVIGASPVGAAPTTTSFTT